MNTLIAKSSIAIEAPITRVWEVLTQSRYIREWDDLPDDFTEKQIQLGSIIEWENQARLTVKEFEPYHRLVLSLYTFAWKLPPSAYDINYSYSLSENNGMVELNIEVGDFAALPDGKSYYDESIKFAEKASHTIKSLAESPLAGSK